MNGLLKDLLEARADSVVPPRFDLDDLIAAGDRRVRRGRWLVGGSVVAALAAVALVGAGIPLALHDSAPEPAGPADGTVRQVQDLSRVKATYAVGEVIDYGGQTIDVGLPVDAFVQSSHGFVVTSGGGVYLADGVAVERIGTSGATYGTELAADPQSQYVAWMDTSSDPVGEFVVYDTSNRDEVARTSEGNTHLPSELSEFQQPAVVDVDHDTVYWHSERGLEAYRVDDGSTTVLSEGASADWLLDARAGQFAYQASQEGAWVVARNVTTETQVLSGYVSSAAISPDGSYVAADPDDNIEVVDTSTRQEVTPSHDAYSFLYAVQWIDGERFTALGFPKGFNSSDSSDDPFDLLVCTVDAGCTVVVSGLHLSDAPEFPVGEATN